MASPNIPLSQDYYFYLSHWSREAETVVISFVHGQISSGTWVVGHHQNSHDVCPFLDEVSPTDFSDQLRQWRRRYHIFTMLNTYHRVTYAPSPQNSPPRALNLIWIELVEICPEVCYYKREGELNWHILKTILRRPSFLYWGIFIPQGPLERLAFVYPVLLDCSDAESIRSSFIVSSWAPLE